MCINETSTRTCTGAAFSCEIRGKLSKRFYHLNHHKKIHIRMKGFDCIKYDFRTKNAAAFRKHNERHSQGLMKERIHMLSFVV